MVLWPLHLLHSVGVASQTKQLLLLNIFGVSKLNLVLLWLEDLF